MLELTCLLASGASVAIAGFAYARAWKMRHEAEELQQSALLTYQAAHVALAKAKTQKLLAMRGEGLRQH